MTKNTDGNGPYFTSAQLKERYQITDMTLWRWIRDENKGFPKPNYFGRRRLFKRDEIDAWEKSYSKVSAA